MIREMPSSEKLDPVSNPKKKLGSILFLRNIGSEPSSKKKTESVSDPIEITALHIKL